MNSRRLDGVEQALNAESEENLHGFSKTLKIWINVRAFYFYDNRSKTRMELQGIKDMLDERFEQPIQIYFFDPTDHEWNKAWEKYRNKCDMMLIYHRVRSRDTIGRGTVEEFNYVFEDSPRFIIYKRLYDESWQFYRASIIKKDNPSDYSDWGTLKLTTGACNTSYIQSVFTNLYAKKTGGLPASDVTIARLEEEDDWYESRRSNITF